MTYSINETARTGATTPNAGLTKTEREALDMADKILPTPEQLRELLRYEPETGKLYWKPRPAELFKDKRSHGAWNARYAGKEAFTAISNQGYRCGRVFDRKHQAHRVSWAVHYGEWPRAEIDHVDNDRRNNRIGNLREATRSENMRNRGIENKNKSGYKGVSWCKQNRKWVARIGVDGKSIWLGRFSDIQDAANAYKTAAKEAFGEFANFG